MSEISKKKTALELAFEAEAARLEKHALENVEDLPDWDPEEGYADLMARLEKKKAEASTNTTETTVHKSGKIHWKMVAVLAAALILVLGLGIGTMGEKIYIPESTVERKDGEVSIKINNEERIERDVKDEDIYQEIEDRLGIFALRLGYKPKGMEIYKVEISEDFGEAKIEYLYKEQILMMYMARDFSKAEINVKSDGEEIAVETVESFNLREKINVLKIENESGTNAYLAEIEKENTAYVIYGNVELDEFLKIIEEIYLKTA